MCVVYVCMYVVYVCSVCMYVVYLWNVPFDRGWDFEYEYNIWMFWQPCSQCVFCKFRIEDEYFIGRGCMSIV